MNKEINNDMRKVNQSCGILEKICIKMKKYIYK